VVAVAWVSLLLKKGEGGHEGQIAAEGLSLQQVIVRALKLLQARGKKVVQRPKIKEIHHARIFFHQKKRGAEDSSYVTEV